jgi:DNA-binding MarR family transcriptional regulator
MQASISAEQADPATDPLARDLGGFLKFVLHRTGRDFYAFLEELDLTLTQMRMLQLLSGEVNEASLKQLADHLGLSLAAVSRAVDNLVRRGLATRSENAEDRRLKTVRITEQALELVDRAIALRIAGLEDFVSSLSDEERSTLAAALAPIVAREDIAARCTEPLSPAPRKDSTDA